ncbi:(4Fe-4S)-binding protein [Kitasatospora sp. NBC_01287]|uniref:(4Fe-4S)-binding protein n=1 Tax=Kitasatospora sp. NBC_01287 TaxID=2903573 RepID=UPI0022579A73|nr:(4Fe-4S)-binding protein [Kitasatospora sp. NBC_01287]MCX4745432.1 (4Fe-4S)-binding protein [Kitasatospora sp. NBC_01287]
MTEDAGPQERPRSKSYPGEGIEVTFEPGLCRHAAECVRGLPEVFDTARRPWITADAADPARVAEVVRRCPTGALTYRWADGRGEEPPRPTEVVRTADGRLLLRDELLLDEEGAAAGANRAPRPAGGRPATRAMLCGCGSSGAQPYCDRSGSCGR